MQQPVGQAAVSRQIQVPQARVLLQEHGQDSAVLQAEVVKLRRAGMSLRASY